MIVLVLWWFEAPLHRSLLLAPLGVIALIGLLLTPFGILYHDVGRALG